MAAGALSHDGAGRTRIGIPAHGAQPAPPLQNSDSRTLSNFSMGQTAPRLCPLTQPFSTPSLSAAPDGLSASPPAAAARRGISFQSVMRMNRENSWVFSRSTVLGQQLFARAAINRSGDSQSIACGNSPIGRQPIDQVTINRSCGLHIARAAISRLGDNHSDLAFDRDNFRKPYLKVGGNQSTGRQSVDWATIK